MREFRERVGHSRECLSADCGFDRTYIIRADGALGQRPRAATAAIRHQSSVGIIRYEESDYQTVEVARLQQIVDAIGIKTPVTLTA